MDLASLGTAAVVPSPVFELGRPWTAPHLPSVVLDAVSVDAELVRFVVEVGQPPLSRLSRLKI